MPEVTSAGSTSDLRARHSQHPIFMAGHGAWDRWEAKFSQVKAARIRYEPSKKAGQPHPDLNFVVLLYTKWESVFAIALSRANARTGCITSGTGINPLVVVFIVFSGSRSFSSFLSQDPELARMSINEKPPPSRLYIPAPSTKPLATRYQIWLSS